MSGPGTRYALRPSALLEPVRPLAMDLPEGYGSRKLFLTARDPHWLYASWDLTSEQRREFNRLSRDEHLIVRIFQGSPGGRPDSELHVHPESRSWFAHVQESGARYSAELGYYDLSGAWQSIAMSLSTFTPPEKVSEDRSAQFATIPPDVTLVELARIVHRAIAEQPGMAAAVERMQVEEEWKRAGPVDELVEMQRLELSREDAPPLEELPSKARAAERAHVTTGQPVQLAAPDTDHGFKPHVAAAEWTPAQAQAVVDALHIDTTNRVWLGSLEITEWIRRELESNLASITLAAREGGPPVQPPQRRAPEAGEVSSPGPLPEGQARKPGFWFSLNAELVLYGATEPDAQLTVSGRRVPLRKDGTFSFRFSLPDGQYDLPISAVSFDGTDGRAAQVSFSRATTISGEVGAHPQAPDLKPPSESF